MAKKYKCRVEYLESTGTQWIDTGIAPSNITPIAKLKFIPTQQISSGNYGIFGCFGANNTRFQVFYNSIGIGTYVSKSWQANTTYEVELNGKIPSATINGSVETSGYSNANGFSSDNMYLFTRNNGDIADNGVSLKLYYCKIWNNEVLVRDFIPVLDNSGKPAMYDQVSGQLFYNQGSGEFSYGRQIIPVEYLESTGTQYIDTGVKGKNNLHYKTKVNFTTLSTGSSNGIGGEYLANASAYIGMVRANGHYTYLFNNTAVETTTTIYANADYEIDSVMNSGSQVLKVNGEIISTGTLPGTFTSTRNIFLYAVCSTNDDADVYGSLRMYYCQIYDNDTLVRDYIPAIDENNTPFMFDKVNNTVYLNAGTGEFKVGPYKADNFNKKLLRKKLALILATLKKKRKYYCEVEYLESTGTQWIDTGIIQNISTELEVNCSFTDLNTGRYGCALGGSRFYFGVISSKWIAGINSSSYNHNIGTADTQRHIFKINKDGFFIDGTNVYTSGGTSPTNQNIALFTCLSGTDYNTFIAKSRCHGVKIYDDGVLVRDMIPVLDWNMKPCLFDKVTEQLFYNQATSGNDFSYGREIHPVEYLEGTGTQYIDTGYKANNKTKVEIKTQGQTWIFGGRTSVAVGDALGICFNANLVALQFGSQSINYNQTGIAQQVSECVISQEGAYINGVLRASFTSKTFNCPNNLYLFEINNNGSLGDGLNGKMWYCRILEGDTLVRDYIPAIDENGVGFMFDRVSHACFLNQGTGAFKYPAREVEYLTSDGNQYIDTGIHPTDDYGYKIRNTYTRGGGEQCAIGCMDNGNRFVGVYTSGAENQLSGAWGSFVNFLPAYVWATGDILDVEVNYKNSRKIIVGGTELKDISDVHISGTISNTLYLFARHYGGTITKMKGNVYSVEITNSQNVVADFIPAFKDGQIGMYDKVGGVLKTNIGTGTFTRGKIVEPEYE